MFNKHEKQTRVATLVSIIGHFHFYCKYHNCKIHGDISFPPLTIYLHCYDVLDHTNHIFSESFLSGDNNDRDQDLQKDKDKDKDTQAKTNKKSNQNQELALRHLNRGRNELRNYCHFFLCMRLMRIKIFTCALMRMDPHMRIIRINCMDPQPHGQA